MRKNYYTERWFSLSWLNNWITKHFTKMANMNENKSLNCMAISRINVLIQHHKPFHYQITWKPKFTLYRDKEKLNTIYIWIVFILALVYLHHENNHEFDSACCVQLFAPNHFDRYRFVCEWVSEFMCGWVIMPHHRINLLISKRGGSNLFQRNKQDADCNSQSIAMLNLLLATAKCSMRYRKYQNKTIINMYEYER